MKNESGVNSNVVERSIDSAISVEAGVRDDHEAPVPWELMEIFGKDCCCCHSFIHQVVSDSWQHHRLQHANLLFRHYLSSLKFMSIE